ncbi:acetyl-CoA carboxylase subunit alpha [Methylophilales bacterium MBRSG12]|uniref:Acetyl-coenzyme A carboxylase carboxyl transferase subunit alpha n=1 Tax=Methylophilales bacterium MBRS-H7 TaxID=1623450 RepID=A0A0H4J2L2_9PROT|nr:acetyl-CoA carboxylase subunit alpha [Methylophilales bacterium MBRSF5]AKO66250.1 acetyl-CoA carboxylase subunit alpha [Methylophilales bacterium MBRS-H7]AKO67568.1 acetyl-CoA carboxylase subunit alpha [Methylophilales bacterium MBRSG12]
MKLHYLEFEKPLQQLASKVEELELAHRDNPKLNISKEVKQLQNKTDDLLHQIYDELTPWQISQVSRHPQRPYTSDYIENIFTNFQELHGDRAFADDPAIIGGLAEFEGGPVMVVGQQKGRDTKERQYRNFGMPRPEGYRKALRLFHLAEKFNLPLITLIDTPGAYPGIGAEERGQSEAIARNLYAMSELKTPSIGIVIGEGGSGGALALGVVDHLMMLQYSTYSVISPEGCASILYKDAKKADIAAESLGITADHLKKVGLADEVIPEPLGGAHRDIDAIMESVRQALIKQLSRLKKQPIDILLSTRYQRLMSYGEFQS